MPLATVTKAILGLSTLGFGAASMSYLPQMLAANPGTEAAVEQAAVRQVNYQSTSFSDLAPPSGAISESLSDAGAAAPLPALQEYNVTAPAALPPASGLPPVSGLPAAPIVDGSSSRNIADSQPTLPAAPQDRTLPAAPSSGAALPNARSSAQPNALRSAQPTSPVVTASDAVYPPQNPVLPSGSLPNNTRVQPDHGAVLPPSRPNNNAMPRPSAPQSPPGGFRDIDPRSNVNPGPRQNAPVNNVGLPNAVNNGQGFTTGSPLVSAPPRSRYFTTPYNHAVFQTAAFQRQYARQGGATAGGVPATSTSAQVGAAPAAPQAGAAKTAYAALPQYAPVVGAYPTSYQCGPVVSGTAPYLPQAGAVPGTGTPGTITPNLAPNYYSYDNGGYSPLLSLGQEGYNVQVGRGIVGQPTVYVPGQPVRNFLRYLFP
ncbi:MAG: hypothetical protein VXZ82_11145 [Planctomycetota bacterium]|nr:hypothetical protein [Planctomycetota bacterium]